MSRMLAADISSAQAAESVERKRAKAVNSRSPFPVLSFLQRGCSPPPSTTSLGLYSDTRAYGGHLSFKAPQIPTTPFAIDEGVAVVTGMPAEARIPTITLVWESCHNDYAFFLGSHADV